MWIWHPDAVAAAEARGSTEGGNLQDAPLYTGGANNFYILAVVDIPVVRHPATLRCSANDLYEVWVEGRWLGRGPAPSDPSYAYVDTYDLVDLPPDGSVRIAFLAFNQGEGSGHPQFQTLLGPGGLWFEVLDADGGVIEASGLSTRLLKAPHIQQGTDPIRTTVWGYEEVWNLAAEPLDWRRSSVSVDGWVEAVPSSFAPASLLDRPMPHLVRWPASPERLVAVADNGGSIRDAQAILAGRTLEVEAAAPYSVPSITLDFGREVVGFPRFDLEGRGGFMVVSYGETLELERIDTVIPDGRAEWGPFHRRSFRFMRLEFFQFPVVRVHSLRVDRVSAPVLDRGRLTTSDPVLDGVWEMGRDTLLTATQDYYEADAWRERAIWFNAVEQRVASVTFGVGDVARETLRMMGRIQDPSGFIPATGPVRNSTLIPDFPQFWIRGLYETVLFTGDLSIGRELFPVLERQMEWYRNERNEAGLLDMTGKPWWVHIDWSRIDRRGEVAAVNLRYIQSLIDASRLARILGREDRAKEWEAVIPEMRAACRARFFDPESGMFYDSYAEGERSSWISQPTVALAILTGVVDQAEARRLLDAVLDPAVLPDRERAFLVANDVFGGWYSSVVDQVGYGEPKGANYLAKIGYCQTPFSAGWFAESMFECGEDVRAVAFIRFFWGEMYRRGGRTTWEIFDPYSQASAVPQRTSLGARFRNSHCHVYGALPTYLLSRYLLGIEPLEPGYQRFSIAPRPSGLPSAAGVVPTPHGDIEISWTSSAGTIDLEVTVPPGAVGVADAATGTRELRPGHHRLRLRGER